MGGLDYLVDEIEAEERLTCRSQNCNNDQYKSYIPRTLFKQALKSLLSNEPRTVVMGFYPDTPDYRMQTFVMEGDRQQAIENLKIYMQQLNDAPASAIQPGMPQSSQFEPLIYLDKQDLAAELARLDSGIGFDLDK